MEDLELETLPYLNSDLGQFTIVPGPSAHLPQGRDDEHVERDECGGWVSGERENGLPPLFARSRFLGSGDAGKGGWFARFNAYSPKVNDASEITLDDGLEKICRSHRCSACGQ